MEKSVICHFFYPELSHKLLQNLKRIDDEETIFFINIQGNSSKHKTLLFDVKENLNNIKILKIPDKGRDIGAKLMLINAALKLGIQSTITLIIHDKKSPHLDSGDIWRYGLYKVIEPKHQKKITKLFETNPKIGIIGASEFVQNEYNPSDDSFISNNDKEIKDQIKKFNINTGDYDFIAGNIFWIRTDLLRTFFAERPILSIRSDLESGNALDFNKGTYIHAWERIMSWIATSQGYKIHGI
jgi:lipopolysaccharide biosynthesis protein